MKRKHNFKVGELVRIDKGMARTKLVTITELYGDTVKDVAYVDAHEWAGSVNIKRLSKIEDDSK